VETSVDVTVGAPKARAKRWAMSLLLASLLLGPTIATEWWAHGSVNTLYAYLEAGSTHPDAKMLLFESVLRSEGCPSLVALGTSKTGRIIGRPHIGGQAVETGGGRIPSIFNYSLKSTRGTEMLAIWHFMQARGCTPKHLLVEAWPIVVNVDDKWRDNLLPYLDLATLGALPDGTVEAKGWSAEKVTEALTYGRLLLHRRRGELQTALLDRLPKWMRGARAVTKPKQPNRDGQLWRGTSYAMTDKNKASVEEKMRAKAARDELVFAFNPIEAEALIALRDAVVASDTKLVLHAPPISEMYREVFSHPDIKDPWCTLRRRLEASTVIFHDDFDADNFEMKDFSDWAHMNKLGAKRYVTGLLASIRDGQGRVGTWCE
jgi:hypothetical protein